MQILASFDEFLEYIFDFSDLLHSVIVGPKWKDFDFGNAATGRTTWRDANITSGNIYIYIYTRKNVCKFWKNYQFSKLHIFPLFITVHQ
jgi:hypothetical protein